MTSSETLKGRLRAKAREALAATAPQDPAVLGGGAGQDAHGAGEAAEMSLTRSVLGWLEDRAPYIERALPSHLQHETGTFTAAALTYLRRSPDLLRCNQDSLLLALTQAAHFGLMPDGRQCALDAYGRHVRFIPMVDGLTDLMYRSGLVTSVRRGLVYEADAWELNPTAPPPDDFIVLPDRLNPDRGQPVLAYAFAWLQGGGRSEVVTFTRPEVEAHRDKYSWKHQMAERAREADPEGFAAAPDEPRFNSFWHTEFDAMWLKTAARALAREVPTSAEVRRLLDADEAADAAWRQTEPYRPVLPLNAADWGPVPGTDDSASTTGSDT